MLLPTRGSCSAVRHVFTETRLTATLPTYGGSARRTEAPEAYAADFCQRVPADRQGPPSRFWICPYHSIMTQKSQARAPRPCGTSHPRNRDLRRLSNPSLPRFPRRRGFAPETPAAARLGGQLFLLCLSVFITLYLLIGLFFALFKATSGSVRGMSNFCLQLLLSLR